MEEKELQEYKQKLKGLSLKDLNDILSHINKDKVPEKYSAVEAEIALRSGAPAPKVEEVKAEAKPEPPKPAAKAEPAPAPAVETGQVKPPTVQLRKSKVSFAQAPEEKTVPKAAVAVPASKPETAAAAPKVKPAPSPKKPMDIVLTAASILFALGGIYFLLIPFANLPGSAALKQLFIKLPPHF